MRRLTGYVRNIHGLDPPCVTRRPWNYIVVQSTFLSDGQSIGITTATIVKSLLDQLGLATQDAAKIVFKLDFLSVYALSKANSTVRPAVNCDFGSLVSSMGDPTTPSNAIVNYGNIVRLEDIGSVSQAAGVSYKWGTPHSGMLLTNQSNFVVATVAANVNEIDCHFHISYSTNDVSDPVPELLGTTLADTLVYGPPVYDMITGRRLYADERKPRDAPLPTDY